jgi:hypothetical protein
MIRHPRTSGAFDFRIVAEQDGRADQTAARFINPSFRRSDRRRVFASTRERLLQRQS